MTVIRFDTLEPVDFENGAVLDEIRAALKEREVMIDGLAVFARAHPPKGSMQRFKDGEVCVCGMDPLNGPCAVHNRAAWLAQRSSR